MNETKRQLIVDPRPQPEIMTPDQMADYLQVSVRQLEDLRRAGRIHHLNIGYQTKRYHLPTVLKSLERLSLRRKRQS